MMGQFFPANAGEPIVHAVLFYSPSCSHCHTFVTEDLPPILKKYGEQLRILPVNIQEAHGNALYKAALKHFKIPKKESGVPTLIVGTEILIGGADIPNNFPQLIETFLAQGGVDWPDIPGMYDMMMHTNSPTNSEAVQASRTAHSPVIELSLSEKLARDPLGNGLAIIVLIGMIFVMLHTLIRFQPNSKHTPTKIVPLLCLLGLIVSSYLAYIEIYHVTAVCGPIGDCNTVQQSEYARLFGILPIGILGVIIYIVMFLTWIMGQYAAKKIAHIARVTVFGLSLTGTLFSIYLTFLEPFVIGATCLWCIASAIIMTSLLWHTRTLK